MPKAHRLTILLLGILAGCAPAPRVAPVALTEDQITRIGQAERKAGIDASLALFLGQDRNAVFSPAGFRHAVSILGEGLTSTYAAQLDRAMGLGPADRRLATRDAISRGEQSGAYSLVGSFWILGPDVRLVESMRPILRENYLAEAKSIPREEAKSTINQWVQGQSSGQFEGLEWIPNPDTAMVAVSVAQFRATWDHPFETADTRKRTFVKTTGRVEADTMHGDISARVWKGKAVEAVALDMADGRYAMVLALPRTKAMDPAEALVGLEFDLAKWENDEVAVAVPKFKFRSEWELDRAMKRLGYPMVVPAGGWSKLVTGLNARTQVLVKQWAMIEVDETGAKAAAATFAEAAKGAVSEPKRIEFLRPFAFVIVDRKSGSPLFSGVVHDPTKG